MKIKTSKIAAHNMNRDPGPPRGTRRYVGNDITYQLGCRQKSGGKHEAEEQTLKCENIPGTSLAVHIFVSFRLANVWLVLNSRMSEQLGLPPTVAGRHYTELLCPEFVKITGR